MNMNIIVRNSTFQIILLFNTNNMNTIVDDILTFSDWQKSNAVSADWRHIISASRSSIIYAATAKCLCNCQWWCQLKS